MPLDFSLLGQGPQFQNVLASYDAGAAAKKESDTKNALALYQTNPEKGINALNQVDPVMGMKLRDDLDARKAAAAKQAVFQEADPVKRSAAAQATGDPNVIDTVMKLDDTQRKQLHDVSDAVGGIAFGALQQAPTDSPEDLAKRKDFITQAAPHLVAAGVPQDKVNEILANPTVAAFHAAMSSALTTQQAIEQANKDRDFTAGQADKTTDNKRADMLAANTIRHDRVEEGQGAQRIADARATAGGSLPSAPSTVHGDAFLGSLAPDQASIVKALATGRMAFPTGTALRTPYWQQMIQSVANYDPQFDAVNYNARSKARADFTSGKSAQNIKALNTAIGHLGRLDDQVGGTAGTGGYYGATMVNKGINALNQSRGDPGITNFEQTASALATELTAVFRGSGGAEADVKRYLGQLNSDASTAQKKAAVKNISDLLNSRLEALGGQYEQGMGTTGDKLNLLNPETQKVLDRINAGKRPPLSSFQK